MQVPFGQHLSYLKKGPVSLKKHIFSASKAQEFLRLMSDTMEAGCECLPDCELMDLQHSVSTSKLMWVRQPLSDQIQAMWFAQPQREPPLHAEGWTTLCTLVSQGEQMKTILNSACSQNPYIQHNFETAKPGVRSYTCRKTIPAKRNGKTDVKVYSSEVTS